MYFSALETVFLTNFQLPFRYETSTDLLTSLRQNTSTHISDDIHEWRRHRRLIKAPILDQILDDWFMKSLLPPISRDVAMGGAVTEEQVISHTQYMDLVYSQSRTLYDLIPQAPHPSTNPAKPPVEIPVDGVVSSIQTPSMVKSAKQPNASIMFLLILRFPLR